MSVYITDMKPKLGIVLIVTLACGTEMNHNKGEESSEVVAQGVSLQDSPDLLEEVWVCHHPNSKMHGQVCIEQDYPDGCYVPGDRTKFCWLLSDRDCNDGHELEWQQTNCHLLGM